MDYGALIQDLGGEYIDLDYFTTRCTHLVVGEQGEAVFVTMHHHNNQAH